jgi:hypothetical protein
MRAVKTKETEHASVLAKEREERAKVVSEREEARRRETDAIREVDAIRATLAKERNDTQAAIFEKVSDTAL